MQIEMIVPLYLGHSHTTLKRMYVIYQKFHKYIVVYRNAQHPIQIKTK